MNQAFLPADRQHESRRSSRSGIAPSAQGRAAARWHRGLLCSLVAGALTGCAVGPNYERPALPATTGYSSAPMAAPTASAPYAGGEAQRFLMGSRVDARWWKLFGSADLDALVERAFAANPNVDAAQAALRVAQANVAAQRGFFYPNASIGYNRTRTKIAGNQTGNAPGPQGDGTVIAGPTVYDYHTAQLTVGYAPDVFGLNKRAVETVQSQALYQQLQLEATYLTLASNVTAAAIQEAMLREQIATVLALIDGSTQSVELVRRQWRAGYVSQLDVSLQESALAQARQQLPPLQKQLDQTRDLLKVLVGETQDAELPQRFELASLTLPTDLPVSLPSQVIEQRPDILAAEAQLKAASAQVGVARANRLPLFNISGNYGGGATHFSQMFWGSGLFFNLAGSVMQPIFDGGTLRNREKAAQETYNQVAAQYKATVLGAYQNVADALHAIEADAAALAAAVEVERSTGTSLALIRRQSVQGYVDRLALLNAEQTHRQALLVLSEAQATRLGDTAALFQALGGGWRDAVAATSGGSPAILPATSQGGPSDGATAIGVR